MALWYEWHLLTNKSHEKNTILFFFATEVTEVTEKSTENSLCSLCPRQLLLRCSRQLLLHCSTTSIHGGVPPASVQSSVANSFFA